MRNVLLLDAVATLTLWLQPWVRLNVLMTAILMLMLVVTLPSCLVAWFAPMEDADERD